ncbi:MAG: hypothetical protein ACI4IV_00670, partial [Acutalibacteraceae bacterium]
VEKTDAVDESKAKTVAVFDVPAIGEELEFVTDTAGNALFIFEVSSNANELAQIPITVDLDKKESSITLSFNGTSGKTDTVRRGAWLGDGRHELTLHIGDIGKIERLTVML